MANKKVSQLTSKPSVLTTDLFPIADPSTGQLYKTTISDLGTAIGSGVSSVNSLVGAVVLDTDDIQELVSPTNKWFTDTRARAALSASSPLTYNSGTGAFGIQVANGSQNGYLSSTDWTTFNAKQAALSGTGFVKSTGGTISYDTNTYLTTSAAASTYLALAGGTMTGALFGASASFSGFVGFNGNTSPLYPVDVAGSGRFSGDLRIESTNPRIYLTDTDNNPDYFISNTDGTFTVYDVTNSTARFTIGTTGNATFANAITGGGSITGQSLYSNGIISAGSSVSATNFILTGGTSPTGLYFGHTDRVVLANYGVGGIDFETNGGTINMTLFPSGNLGVGVSLTDAGYKLDVAGTGRFTGALSGTSATFSGPLNINTSFVFLPNGASRTNFSLNGTSEAMMAIGVGGNWQSYWFTNSSGMQLVTNSTNSIYIGNASGNFQIASSGAATFSSSVTSVTSGANSGFNTGALIAKSNGNNFRYTQIGYDNTSNYGWIQALEQGTAYTNLILNGAGGNVGIGTTSPYNPGGSAQTSLEMSGTSYSTIYLSANSATVRGQFTADNLNSWVEMGARTNHPLLFLTNNAERMRIRADGNVGVGTTGSSSIRLITAGSSNQSSGYSFVAADVGGNTLLGIRNDGLIDTGLAGNSPYNLTRVGRSMIVDSSGLIGYLASTRESKINISDLTDISFLYKLNPKSFNYRKTNQISNEYTNEYIDELHYGLIADEVEKVNKELVFYNEKNGMKELAGVEYQKLTSVLIKAVQDLKAELDTLKNK